MTEQDLISSAMTISFFVSPICMFFNAKLAWDEARWLFYNAFIPEPDSSNYTPFCWRFIIPLLWHSALMIWGVCFTVYGAFFTYECAKWFVNLEVK